MSNEIGSKTLKIQDKEIIHQAHNVLRLKIGEQINLFTGLDDFNYIYKIRDIGKKEIFVEFINKETGLKRHFNQNIEEEQAKDALDLKINVYVSIIKSDFDKVVRELVEIGADNIIPTISEKTERKEINTERFHKIITEATEQSGRTFLPRLHNVIKLKDLLESGVFNLKENQENTLSEKVNLCYHTEVSQTKQDNSDHETNSECSDKGENSKARDLNIFIGPEGGWSEDEMNRFKDLGFEIKKLNTFILKTSTAGVLCTYDAIKSFT
jgi:16S rRNA (uracil1498-N3)-methyltransferase